MALKKCTEKHLKRKHKVRTNIVIKKTNKAKNNHKCKKTLFETKLIKQSKPQNNERRMSCENYKKLYVN